MNANNLYSLLIFLIVASIPLIIKSIPANILKPGTLAMSSATNNIPTIIVIIPY